MSTDNPHARIDAINLALDRATAAKIRTQPELIEIGKANLRRWMQHDDGFVHPVHAEWMDILNFLTPAEIAAAKSLLYRVGWQAERGNVDRRDLHALAAAVKLVCSETAGRVIDRAVQIHGGRGYMREHPVERLWRELRVDRIWEGTSEIQRVIIADQLLKRGPRVLVGEAPLEVTA